MTALWMKQAGTESAPTAELAKLEAGALLLDRPTVIFLTGVSTTVKTPRHITGAINHVETMLGGAGLAGKVNVGAWAYDRKRSNLKNAFNYNCRPNSFYSKQAEQLVHDFLLSHLASDYAIDPKTRKVSGAKRPVSEVKARFKNLTFLAYSYGAVFSQEVYNAARQAMRQLNYSDRQARALLSHIPLISLGAVSRPMREVNRFTSICMVATNDRLAQHKSRIWFSLREVFARFARKLTIRRLTKRNYYISAPAKKDIWEERADKDGNIVKRKIRQLFPKWWPRHSYHELPHYTTDKDCHNEFSNIARYALANCLTRTGPIRPDQMIAPYPPANDNGPGSEAHQKYRARITAALR